MDFEIISLMMFMVSVFSLNVFVRMKVVTLSYCLI